MKLLLAVATKPEIAPFVQHFGLESGRATFRNHEITLINTGVGMIATAYEMGKHLALNQYDLAINAGIAGSFDPSLKIGDVVSVKEDHIAELGAENENAFIRIDELGFGKSCIEPIASQLIDLTDLTQVRGITVNTVHGNTHTIEVIEQRLQPQIETMEGAAFFYACNDVNLPSVQIRSISNVVEQRNTGRWDIGLAIENLNEYLVKLVDDIN